MENNRSENFDFNLDDLLKSSENEDTTLDPKKDPIKNPDSFNKDAIFKREPLKTIDAEKENKNKLEEARKKIRENHQGNS